MQLEPTSDTHTTHPHGPPWPPARWQLQTSKTKFERLCLIQWPEPGDLCKAHAPRSNFWNSKSSRERNETGVVKVRSDRLSWPAEWPISSRNRSAHYLGPPHVERSRPELVGQCSAVGAGLQCRSAFSSRSSNCTVSVNSPDLPSRNPTARRWTSCNTSCRVRTSIAAPLAGLMACLAHRPSKNV
jgi:hypothetical protein